MVHHSNSSIWLRCCLLWLCIAMIIIQLSQALNDNSVSSSAEENDSPPLYRRSSKKVAQMLQQILQRGEMQVQPSRIHKFLHRLNRRQVTD